MEGIDTRTILLAALLTVFLFISIYALNMFLGERREDVVTEKMEEIIEEFEEVETSAYLMRFLQEKNDTCDILVSELNFLESRLWNLDIRIKEYREISRDFASDEFYIKEKKRLNRREIIHLSMLDELKKICDYQQTVILYFYGECEKNRLCEQQGLVLTYINQRIDPEIAIFSFDADLDLPSVNSLMKLYNITEYPCVVIEDHTHCGLHNSMELRELMCKYNKELSICLGGEDIST